MYDLILNALYRFNNLNSVEEKAQYLQSLKPAARKLRTSFNPYSAPNVRVSYAPKEMQSAYMLRYYPYYSQIIHIILNRLRGAQVPLPFGQEELSACFFGAGPAPEVYGFIQFLNSHFKDVRKVSAYAFDIISDEWAYGRSVTENHLIPSIWQNREFTLIGNRFDLSQRGSTNKLTTEIGISKLLVFQNCLNEINPGLYPNVIANFNSLVQVMSSGSVLLIIDLSSYPTVQELITQIEHSIRNQNLASVLLSLSEGRRRYDAVAIRNALPSIIQQNLLTGEDGLIPRRNVDYHCLVIRKH